MFMSECLYAISVHGRMSICHFVMNVFYMPLMFMEGCLYAISVPGRCNADNKGY